MLTSKALKKIKTRALRRKLWFKALSSLERSVVDLTIRCVEEVRSRTLEKAILTVLNKLFEFLNARHLNQAMKVGREIAEQICEIALKWGNLQAWTWKYDMNFVRFLGVSALST